MGLVFGYRGTMGAECHPNHGLSHATLGAEPRQGESP